MWFVAGAFIAIWLLGLYTSSALGEFIHLFLVAATILIVVRVIKGRKIF